MSQNMLPALHYSHVRKHQPVVRVVPAVLAVHSGESINNVCAELRVDLCLREISHVAVDGY